MNISCKHFIFVPDGHCCSHYSSKLLVKLSCFFSLICDTMLRVMQSGDECSWKKITFCEKSLYMYLPLPVLCMTLVVPTMKWVLHHYDVDAIKSDTANLYLPHSSQLPFLVQPAELKYSLSHSMRYVSKQINGTNNFNGNHELSRYLKNSHIHAQWLCPIDAIGWTIKEYSVC